MKNENERKEAVALTYDPESGEAPRVTAKGHGYIADKILDRAKEADVPVQEDATLIELLSELNINEQIPEELYQVVAEVFAFIYQSDKEMKQNRKNVQGDKKVE
ncbi:EscU/YscU/HrcU family type III secretion system export apparatus switch protein [Salimicrobium halophilum]|uniref:Flagellar biosynthesis protein n=1 Tax=Salimicrobium halophilum TaxID=86666 RepID=A0A1G8QCN9_9BACI|nr:EscU/YscU/HrcU family type III secretion system export apparatus switch protein [Salimicrobium halophilum]SDJ02215.1 flagellar biosynthesis protein [Salimicrobium halophilum]